MQLVLCLCTCSVIAMFSYLNSWTKFRLSKEKAAKKKALERKKYYVNVPKHYEAEILWLFSFLLCQKKKFFFLLCQKKVHQIEKKKPSNTDNSTHGTDLTLIQYVIFCSPSPRVCSSNAGHCISFSTTVWFVSSLVHWEVTQIQSWHWSLVIRGHFYTEPEDQGILQKTSGVNGLLVIWWKVVENGWMSGRVNPSINLGYITPQ